MRAIGLTELCSSLGPPPGQHPDLGPSGQPRPTEPFDVAVSWRAMLRQPTPARSAAEQEAESQRTRRVSEFGCGSAEVNVGRVESEFHSRESIKDPALPTVRIHPKVSPRKNGGDG